MVGEKIAILIIGAGIEAIELIDSLCRSEGMAVTGVVDRNLNAPGIKSAKETNTPTGTDYKQFLNLKPLDLIINLTGSDAVQKELLEMKPKDAEIIGRKGIGLLKVLAESMASEGEAKYQSVFKNMSGGVAYHKILTDKDGKPVDYIFLEVNRAFEKLIGFEREKVITKRVTQILPWVKDTMFDWVNFYGKVASTGKEIKFEQYLKNMDRWYAVSAFSPKKGYFITIYNDITELKKAESSLRKAYDTLKKTQDQLIRTEKMELVGKLASGVAHEVKNPLAILLQGTDYLSKKINSQDEDIGFVLNSMNDAIKRASNIIKDLTDFSRVSNMQISPEDLTAAVDNSLLLVENDIKKRNISVIREFDMQIPKVELDVNRMKQVFINLFMNAMQAMPNGGQLKISTYEKKDEKGQNKVVVEIADTGSGIPEDVLGNIFDPFFTTKDIGEGTGLGLSIVRNIIEGHNGNIKIENRTDRSGVRATIEFKSRNL
ncbi:MAG: hypothetical protein A2Z72_00705 [Omnitrophica bacterium RBG_13_46_9]|nr:MAG: hypothetical protein A2Z72_00705 [Omnitrophica bacterium RBG_13_46_9]